MYTEAQFPKDLFLRDDAEGLQRALEQWEQPTLDTLLALLDQAAEKPHTTACLLNYLHRQFPANEIETSLRLRREKQLGLLDWEDEDWSECFRWEIVGDNCRILEYLGQDEEVLIPEEIGGRSVSEVARIFFLHAASVRRLLVPKEIRVGSVMPREAVDLFGKQLDRPEIFYLDREQPPARPIEAPVVSFAADHFYPGGLVQFGHYAYGKDGDSQSISWLVLRRESDRALLVTDQVLEQLPYHHNRNAVLWAGSDLRCWLNDGFLQAAFSEEERAMLLPVALTGEPNPVFRTRDNSHSQDRVFLLSPQEWDSCKNLLNKSMLKTPWAMRKDEGFSRSETCPIWTRMPGLNAQYAVVFNTAAQLDYQGTLVNDLTTGVCPAVWIQI